MRFYLFFLPLFLLTVPTLTLHATIIHVPGDSTTIQGGINGVVNGDTVMVSPGTYYEYDIDFLGKAIMVMGTDPLDSAVVAATVVDADSLGSVFHFHSGEDSTSVLTGLTLTGGLADVGGGIQCLSSSPMITRNIITGNVATGVDWIKGGGGIYCDSSNPIISHNIIINNSTNKTGGGIKCYYSSPTITYNVFSNNSSLSDGGGISCLEYASPNIISNEFKNNVAGNGGGGISSYWYSTPMIKGNLIARNFAENVGGGIYYNRPYTTVFVINNTITENSANGYNEEGGGGLWFGDASPIVKNTIVWGNTAPYGPEIYSWHADPEVTYSDVKGGWVGEGNIGEDPEFIDPLNGDYHLEQTSPCVDTGDPSIFDACLPPGLGEERSDMGAYGGEDNCEWLPINYNPTILTSPDTTAVAGLEYYYDVDAEDLNGDTLSFSLQVSPSWLSINSITGIITGIPPSEAIGDTTVTVLVEDGFGGSDDQTFPLVVLPQVDLTLEPDDSTTIPVGGILYFNTHIQNNRETSVEGDVWLVVMMPDSTELLIPEILLNYTNPLHGQIFSLGSVELTNEFWIHPRADTGSYQLIGRIGQYPDGVADEESFGFQVVE